jgi:hypothetical protein
MSMFSSSTKEVETAVPTVQPQASQTYSDPAMEMASRQMLDAYFNPEYGMIGQKIPIPIQQVAGLSPQEIQARNLAGGLGGFGAQLAEAQDMYRQGSQAFDPSTAGLFADPQARALYEQSTRGYDPSMGQQFMDQDARRMMMGAAGDIRGAEQGMSREALMAQQAMRDASGQVGSAARSGQQGMGSAGDDISRAIAQAQQGMNQAGMGAGRESAFGQQQIRDAAAGIRGQVGSAQAGAMDAAQRARMQTQMAGQDLRSAGQMGQAAAMQGIAGLAGTGDQYDPSSASSFMDPFNRDVIDAQQAEIARLGEKQKIAARDQAVRSGAFGGSRGAIAEAEIGRNVLQQQAKTGAELRSQGFQQAQQQAQQSFEQAQGRRQQAAQMTGSLGQAGAQTGISAAQQAANLGLSAEQLAQRSALESGQLGMTGQMNQGQLAQQAAQMGISTQELQGRLAQQSGQMGLQGGQARGDLAQRAAQLGMSAGEYAGQMAQQGGALGLQAQQGIGALAGQRAGIGQNLGSQFQSAQQLGSNVFGDQMNRMQGAASGMGGLTNQQFGNAMNAYQMTGANQRAGAQGIAGLGRQGQEMLGTQISTLNQMGGQGRGIQQAGLDAQYKAGTQMADEPFMRLQRGQQMLQGAQPFMPSYSSGYSVGSNQNSTYQKPSTFSKVANIAGTVASFFPSDIRLKENVVKVDEVEPGVGWYTWDWNDTAKAMGVDDQTEGVIAQELMEVDPGAVAMGDDGYYRVDYSKVKRDRTGVQ